MPDWKGLFPLCDLGSFFMDAPEVMRQSYVRTIANEKICPTSPWRPSIRSAVQSRAGMRRGANYDTWRQLACDGAANRARDATGKIGSDCRILRTGLLYGVSEPTYAAIDRMSSSVSFATGAFIKGAHEPPFRPS